MGEYITIGEGLTITLFSMLVVFLVLVLLSYLIKFLSEFINKDEAQTVEYDKSKVRPVSEPAPGSKIEEKIDDEELVAVISAAIAASLGVSVPEINIKSIKRTHSTNNSWSEMGRVEQLSGKL